MSDTAIEAAAPERMNATPHGRRSSPAIPDATLDDRLGIVGTAGSGKTYGAGTAVERILARKGRCIIPDPLGVWWGLRLTGDGLKPSPFDVVIFGGPHGDLPLNEHAGALIGETVAGMKESAIIDLSDLGTKAAERRFMLQFLTTLYRHASKEPVHLIFDEADMWAPQTLFDKEGDAAKLLGMMETIVRRGRAKGFIPWLITQRPAVVNKDVLSQVDGLIAFKLTSSQDRAALKAWVEGQADKGQWLTISNALPTKARGEAVVWLPQQNILESRTFPTKATFDSSRTPKRGEKRQVAELKPLDLGALKERLATVKVEVEANDPKLLRQKIAKLELELTRARKAPPPEADPAALDAAYQLGRLEGAADLRQQFVRCGEAAQASLTRIDASLEEFASTVADLKNAIAGLPTGNETAPAPRTVPARPRVAREVTPLPRAKPAPRAPVNGGGALPPGERAVLVAAVQYQGVDRDQLSVLTGYKRSSRDAYIQRLREKGYVETSGQTISPTDDGAAALGGDYEPLPTGVDLQRYWQQRLPEGEARILAVLVEAYPEYVDRVALDEITGYKRSSRDAYLQRLKARRLVEIGSSSARASETLF